MAEWRLAFESSKRKKERERKQASKRYKETNGKIERKTDRSLQKIASIASWRQTQKVCSDQIQN